MSVCDTIYVCIICRHFFKYGNPCSYKWKMVIQPNLDLMSTMVTESLFVIRDISKSEPQQG